MVIDHVLEPATMRKIPLQSPFVIKVRQETVLQMYGLKFQSVSITEGAKLDFPNKLTGLYRRRGIE